VDIFSEWASRREGSLENVWYTFLAIEPAGALAVKVKSLNKF
jgi:hypothetical protein